MTTRDVGKMLSMSAGQVTRLAAVGRIPAIRIGGQWRFKPNDVDVWLFGGCKPEQTYVAKVEAELRRWIVGRDEFSVREFQRGGQNRLAEETQTAIEVLIAEDLIVAIPQPYNGRGRPCVPRYKVLV